VKYPCRTMVNVAGGKHFSAVISAPHHFWIAVADIQGFEAQVDRAATCTEFVYPNGCSLSVQPPALPLLTSGSAAHPQKACIMAMSDDMTSAAKRARGMPQHASEKICRGRILVLGSADLLGDAWLDKEQNAILMRCVRRNELMSELHAASNMKSLNRCVVT
jgi:hypothetical protein